MLDNIPDTYAKGVGFPIHDLTASYAVETAKVHERAEVIAGYIDVENLEGEMLTRRVYQLTGVKRNAAVKAVGEVTVTGTGTVPQGSIFSTVDGIEYIATEEAVISESGKVAIEAVEGGVKGNVGAGAIVKIPVTITGITEVKNEEPTRNGYAEESDAELRERFYKNLEMPIVSGNKYHYVKWAEEVAGVGGAKCFPLAYGNNTVEVCIIGNDGKPATEELIDAVQEYIDPNSSGLGEGEAPGGAYCTVTTAAGKSLDISATVMLAAGSTISGVTETFTANLNAMLKANAFESTYISYAQVANILFNTAGVVDYSNLLINNGTVNIEIGEREVAVMGVLTLNE